MKSLIANGEAHRTKPRDFDLADKVSRLPDSTFVGPNEVSALSGFALTSMQNASQRCRLGMPPPLKVRHLTWRLGDIRDWLESSDLQELPEVPPHKKIGRPTKAEQVSATRKRNGSGTTPRPVLHLKPESQKAKVAPLTKGNQNA